MSLSEINSNKKMVTCNKLQVANMLTKTKYRVSPIFLVCFSPAVHFAYCALFRQSTLEQQQQQPQR